MDAGVRVVDFVHRAPPIRLETGERVPVPLKDASERAVSVLVPPVEELEERNGSPGRRRRIPHHGDPEEVRAGPAGGEVFCSREECMSVRRVEAGRFEDPELSRGIRERPAE